MKKNLKQSAILKGLCYILIPIFIITIIVSIIYTAWIAENEDMKDANSVEETNAFADNYISSMYNMLERIENSKYYFSRYTDTIYVAHSYYRSSDTIKFVVIDNETGLTYTNLELTGNIYLIDEIKEKLSEVNSRYCNYNCITNQLDTNINNMRISKLTLSSISEKLEENSSYEIYTVVNEKPNIYNENYIQKIAFNICKSLGELPTIWIPILIILTIVMCIYLLFAIGHKKGYENIYLNRFDKWPIEILLTIIISAISILIAILMEFDWNDFYSITTNIILTVIKISIMVLVYGLLALITTIIIKKIKSHTLWNSSVIYKIIKWIQKIIHGIFENMDTNIKIIAIFLGSILFSIILISGRGIFILAALVFWIFMLYKIIKKVNEFIKIKGALKNIYNGKTDTILNEEEFSGDLKEVSKYINDIQSGFANAINEKLKSERMKTDLITNVSHDIKTPLTSIINYVDLLKEEEINNEKAKEYIKILDSKSQRLKKLIEDLVEASKASSGNIKLNIEKINLVELLKQTTGEFEDKFKDKNLKVEMTVPNESIYINADNRYMYRIIENVFSNISKYSLEGSRVYIDITKKDNKAKIEIKNISKEKLNISAEELMQRFVRGDKSRTTEGSGLGLSISQSLTKLQNGEFNIIIDGDLFKVEIVF